jgi:hypothetical protein
VTLATLGVQFAALPAGTAAVCCAAMWSKSTDTVRCTCPHDGQVGGRCPLHHKKTTGESESLCRLDWERSGETFSLFGAIGVVPPPPDETKLARSGAVPASPEASLVDVILLPLSPPPRA